MWLVVACVEASSKPGLVDSASGAPRDTAAPADSVPADSASDSGEEPADTGNDSAGHTGAPPDTGNAASSFDVHLAAADLLLEGAGWDHAGVALHGPGDLDGDGYQDLVVAAMPGSEGGAPKPTFYWLRGGPAFGAGFVHELAAASWQDGESYDHYYDPTGPLGDIDGDGLVAMGVTTWDAYTATDGVYGLDGTVPPGPVQAGAFVVLPSARCPYFGDSIAGGGDVDGDGHTDLFVGDEGISSGRDALGGGYLWRGPVGTGETCDDADVRLVGEVDYPLAGSAASVQGDIDGDGAAELVVANREPYAGAVYVVSDPVDGDASLADAAARVRGDASNYRFGAAITVLDDGDGDGYADLLVSAPYETPSSGSNQEGVVRLWRGPVAGDHDPSSADLVVEGDASARGLGTAIAPAPSLLGPGAFAVGVPWAEPDGLTQAGVVYVVAGGRSGTLRPGDVDGVIRGDAAGDLVGAALVSPGDLDADGEADFVVGAPENDAWDGHVGVFLGPGP